MCWKSLNLVERRCFYGIVSSRNDAVSHVAFGARTIRRQKNVFRASSKYGSRNSSTSTTIDALEFRLGTCTQKDESERVIAHAHARQTAQSTRTHATTTNYPHSHEVGGSKVFRLLKSIKLDIQSGRCRRRVHVKSDAHHHGPQNQQKTIRLARRVSNEIWRPRSRRSARHVPKYLAAKFVAAHTRTHPVFHSRRSHQPPLRLHDIIPRILQASRHKATLDFIPRAL